MKRIVKGLTLINSIPELRRVPKLEDNIMYYVPAPKTNTKYDIKFANLFDPVVLSPFIKEGLLLPFWVFEFMEKVFFKFFTEEEKTL